MAKDDPKDSDLDWTVLDRDTDDGGDYTVTWSVTTK